MKSFLIKLSAGAALAFTPPRAYKPASLFKAPMSTSPPASKPLMSFGMKRALQGAAIGALGMGLLSKAKKSKGERQY